jgi:hypothetical protein
LQRLFLIEATKYSVLPLDDRRAERFNADLAGRPQLIKGKSQILFGGMSRLSEGSLVVTTTSRIRSPRRSRCRSPALYAHNGKLKHCYNVWRRTFTVI